MLDYTITAIYKVLDDLKRGAFCFSVAVQCVGIIYLIYAICVGAGMLWANIALGVISLAYLIFYIVTYPKNDKAAVRVKRATAGWCKWSRLAIKAFTLGEAIWGVYIAIEHFTPISALLMTISALGWICQVLIEIAIKYIEGRVEYIVEGVKTDFLNITRPVRYTTNFVRKITGKEVVEVKEEPTKKHLILDKLVEERREERTKRKEEKREKKRVESQERIAKIKNDIKERLEGGFSQKFRIKRKEKPSQPPLPVAPESNNESVSEPEMATKN
jgi:hypothetical protein